MSLFHYRAYSSTGETVTGAVEAESVPALETRLRQAGSWLLDARAEGTLETNREERVSRVRVKRAEIVGFFVQMSLLLRAGITLPNALQQLGKDLAETRMGAVATTLCEKVSIGTSLHQAMETFPRVFSRQVVAMVEAGEVSGQMPEVFQSLSDYFEWMDGLVAEIRQALIYPIMVLIAASALVTLLFTFVVPRFVGLLTDLSLEVPLLTRIVMAISNVFVRGWPVLLGLAIGLPIAHRLALRNPVLARNHDRALMRLPIFGPLVAMFGLSRFANNLGMLYRSGIPLLKGLQICQDLVGNRAIAHALADVHQGVLEGTPMSKGMARHDVFPGTVVTMVATGETSGSLDDALQSVASYYNALIPRRIKVVFAVFNPVVMLSLIGVVGVVALSVVLPILQLWQMK